VLDKYDGERGGKKNASLTFWGGGGEKRKGDVLNRGRRKKGEKKGLRRRCIRRGKGDLTVPRYLFLGREKKKEEKSKGTISTPRMVEKKKRGSEVLGGEKRERT